MSFVVALIGLTTGATPEKLSLDQLGGGHLIALALAADLARRMAQGTRTWMIPAIPRRSS